MKKKYFTPEMEEFKYEIPTVMQESEAQTSSMNVCIPYDPPPCEDTCPWDG